MGGMGERWIEVRSTNLKGGRPEEREERGGEKEEERREREAGGFNWVKKFSKKKFSRMEPGENRRG